MLHQLKSDNFQEFITTDVPVVVYFSAPWCAPCKVMGPLVDTISKTIEDAKFGKVNVDENQDIAKEFEIISIPTLIFFKNGKPVDRLKGIVIKSVIEAKISELKN